MASKEPAMRPTGNPVSDIVAKIAGPRQREAEELIVIMSDITGKDCEIWANRIFGFGTYEYVYETGHSGRAPVLGFATNSTKHTIYLSEDFATEWPDLMARLGTYTASKVCLYVSRLTNIDMSVLRELLERTVADVNGRYPSDVDGHKLHFVN